MEYKESLHDLSWPELLQQLSAILQRDQKTLENNISYYKKMFSDSNPDKEQLNRLFDKLQLDKLRLNYFSELSVRLNEQNYASIITQLENCIKQEINMQNLTPKNWAATVLFERDELQVYFTALSYYP